MSDQLLALAFLVTAAVLAAAAFLFWVAERRRSVQARQDGHGRQSGSAADDPPNVD
jgi:hypothetical protein